MTTRPQLQPEACRNYRPEQERRASGEEGVGHDRLDRASGEQREGWPSRPRCGGA